MKLQLFLAELEAVGFMNPPLADEGLVKSLCAPDELKFPVLLRNEDDAPCLIAFCVPAVPLRFLSMISLSWRTKIPWRERHLKYFTPFTIPLFLPEKRSAVANLLVFDILNPETNRLFKEMGQEH